VIAFLVPARYEATTQLCRDNQSGAGMALLSAVKAALEVLEVLRELPGTF